MSSDDGTKSSLRRSKADPKMAVSDILETAMLYPEYVNVLRLLRTWDLRGQNVIPLVLALFNAWGAMSNLWGPFSRWVRKWLMVSISVPSNDDLFDQIVDWLEDKHALRTTDLLVKSNPEGKASARTPRYDYDEDSARAQEAKEGPSLSYSPDMGTYYFTHKARIFRFTRRVERDFNEYSSRKRLQGQVITMSCVAWSAAPIKNLFIEIQTWKSQTERFETIIRHPSLGFRGNKAWSRLMTRPARPIETVVMDEIDKWKIIEHVREYLKKETVKWYADRGIPYRLGLLFWGPSGTGYVRCRSKVLKGLTFSGLIHAPHPLSSMLTP